MATRTERGPLDPRPAIAALQEYDPPESAERLARRRPVTFDAAAALIQYSPARTPCRS